MVTRALSPVSQGATAHKATTSDIKHDAAALALSETFTRWMANKEEVIAKREETKRQEKDTTFNQFFDLTKRAIEVEESIAKAKTLEVEVKPIAEDREIMSVNTTNMTEGQKAWVQKRRTIVQQRDT
jgi:hypothetical protein